MKESDITDYIHVGTGDKDEKIKRAKNGTLAFISSRKGLINYLKNAISKTKGIPDVIPYMKVDNQLAKEINKAFNNDVDVTGYFWALNKDTLFHSYKGHHIAKANNLDMSIEQLADGLENINKGVIFKEKWDKEKNTRKITLLIASGEDFIYIADIYGGKKGQLTFTNAWRMSEEQFKKSYGNTPGVVAILEKVRNADNVNPTYPISVPIKDNITPEQVNSNHNHPSNGWFALAL